ncbi:aspartyl/asparaginyl beta-hydroxylase domain-containing protein [Massilia glaciei]|nr:aspartyl/asparaginyl beta-hydroxylase domain-containing protein [Massilia glaciei]
MSGLAGDPARRPTRYLKLPLAFDAAPLQAELAQMLGTGWIDHYNTTAYASGWQCIPLRSVGGRLDHIIALDGQDYAPTVVLERSPQFQRVLAGFECDLQSVRLMSLAPGARILPHRDPGTGFEDGLARLHVPILTRPGVVFTIDGEDVHFSQGDTWYLNANCEHAVANDSDENRVHLMLDCVPNAWLEALFARAGYVAPPAPHYGDPNINDANVDDVIASLRAGGGAGALLLAERLGALAGSARSAPP